jgi:hypothetical protein
MAISSSYLHGQLGSKEDRSEGKEVSVSVFLIETQMGWIKLKNEEIFSCDVSG